MLSKILLCVLLLASSQFTTNDAIFSTMVRTPYCAFDTKSNKYVLGFWLQDVIYDVGDKQLILRYTTSDASNPAVSLPNIQTGHMSVYEKTVDNIKVLVEYAIHSDKNGFPTYVFGVQEYQPSPIFTNSIIPSNTSYVNNSTVGKFTYCSDYPCDPAFVAGSYYNYSVVTQTQQDSPYFWIHENMTQRNPTAIYSRTFVYEIGNTKNPLVAMVDYVNHLSYFRFKTVDGNGVCN